MAKKRGLRHHIIHKGRLSLLLIFKIFFVLLSFFVVITILSSFSPFADIGQASFFNIIMWVIGLAVVIILYLFLIIRVLKLLKFK